MNLSLTDELRTFINNNSGDGTAYATPSEFIRSIVRDKKERMEAAELRAAVIDGYQDAIDGRTITFNGSLQDALKAFKHQEEQGWD